VIGVRDVAEPLQHSHDTWARTVLRAHGIAPKWSARHNYKGLSPECKAAYRRINLRWHDIRHEYASGLVERSVPLAQVRDLLGHASITTTERYDIQRLENLQLAASKLERGLTFEPPAPEPPSGPPTPSLFGQTARTKFQEFFKYEVVPPRSSTVRETPALEPNELEDLNSADWLGGRDSNPDTVVQRAANGFRSVPVHSVLFKSSALPLQYIALRSALFTHKMSHCVSAPTSPGGQPE